MPLPDSITEYFDLMEGSDKTRTIRVFAPDAQVTDDGHRYRGHDEILAWLSSVASEYVTTARQLSTAATDTGAIVVVRLEGNFPGGRVDLTHSFDLTLSGAIDRLAIAP